MLQEFILYGLNLWSINYLHIWQILAAAAWLLRKMTHPLGWAPVSYTHLDVYKRQAMG